MGRKKHNTHRKTSWFWPCFVLFSGFIALSFGFNSRQWLDLFCMIRLWSTFMFSLHNRPWSLNWEQARCPAILRDRCCSGHSSSTSHKCIIMQMVDRGLVPEYHTIDQILILDILYVQAVSELRSSLSLFLLCGSAMIGWCLSPPPRFLTPLIFFWFVYPIRSLLAMSAATFFSCGRDPKVITRVFAVFIVRWSLTIQSSRAIRSDCSIVAALCWSSSWYDASVWVSSAYITTSLLMYCGRSFVYMVNNTGPTQLPCGTPLLVGRNSDNVASCCTAWVLAVRYDRNQSQ